MKSMAVAESAMLLQFHAVRNVLLVFVRSIISLLALSARQRNNYPHALHLPRLAAVRRVRVETSVARSCSMLIHHFDTYFRAT